MTGRRQGLLWLFGLVSALGVTLSPWAAQAAPAAGCGLAQVYAQIQCKGPTCILNLNSGTRSESKIRLEGASASWRKNNGSFVSGKINVLRDPKNAWGALATVVSAPKRELPPMAVGARPAFKLLKTATCRAAPEQKIWAQAIQGVRQFIASRSEQKVEALLFSSVDGTSRRATLFAFLGLNEAFAKSKGSRDFQDGEPCLAMGFSGVWVNASGRVRCSLGDNPFYEKYSKLCSSGTLACNPGVFGLSESAQPICVSRAEPQISVKCEALSKQQYPDYETLAEAIRRGGLEAEFLDLAHSIDTICGTASLGSDVNACAQLRPKLDAVRLLHQAEQAERLVLSGGLLKPNVRRDSTSLVALAPKVPAVIQAPLQLFTNASSASSAKGSVAPAGPARAPRNVAVMWGGHGDPVGQSIFENGFINDAQTLRDQGWEVRPFFAAEQTSTTSKIRSALGLGTEPGALPNATNDALIYELKRQARDLVPGDQLSLVIHSHGSSGGIRHAWNGLSVGDEKFQQALSEFKSRGIKLAFFDSSCFSGASVEHLSKYGCVVSASAANTLSYSYDKSLLTRTLSPADRDVEEYAKIKAALGEAFDAKDPTLALDDLFLFHQVGTLNAREYANPHVYTTWPDTQPLISGMDPRPAREWSHALSVLSDKYWQPINPALRSNIPVENCTNCGRKDEIIPEEALEQTAEQLSQLVGSMEFVDLESFIFDSRHREPSSASEISAAIAEQLGVIRNNRARFKATSEQIDALHAKMGTFVPGEMTLDLSGLGLSERQREQLPALLNEFGYVPADGKFTGKGASTAHAVRRELSDYLTRPEYMDVILGKKDAVEGSHRDALSARLLRSGSYSASEARAIAALVEQAELSGLRQAAVTQRTALTGERAKLEGLNQTQRSIEESLIQSRSKLINLERRARLGTYLAHRKKSRNEACADFVMTPKAATKNPQ